ncbi:MAG: HTTM domain-containing protein [Fibrobacteres bacterium]|nr:HTTM domain-containing protein [Fibrobacterota bacterium]
MKRTAIPVNWLSAFFSPQPLIRLAFLRVCLPPAILGFLSLRMVHASDWLSVNGFSVPRMATGDWRQPLYLAPLQVWQAWALCAATVAAGTAFCLGFYTRLTGALFAVCLIYLALADRLAAFTVSKLGAVLILALIFTPCGERISLDALRRGSAAKTVCTWGNARFFQVLLVLFYCLAGLAKVRGDWLREPNVLFSHLQDSYQTWGSYFLARHVPLGFWHGLRWVVMGLEVGAPLWFMLPWTRLPALCAALGMHAFIGIGFGPVAWFGLLMCVYVTGAFAPPAWLEAFFAWPRKALRDGFRGNDGRKIAGG